MSASTGRESPFAAASSAWRIGAYVSNATMTGVGLSVVFQPYMPHPYALGLAIFGAISFPVIWKYRT